MEQYRATMPFLTSTYCRGGLFRWRWRPDTRRRPKARPCRYVCGNSPFGRSEPAKRERNQPADHPFQKRTWWVYDFE